MTNELRHTPKLRLLSAFLAAAMTLTTLPAAAFAADGITSDLSVAGTSVTADNATDILGDGTAKYEGSVLTLSGEITVPQNKAGIMPIRSITIDGTGTLTAQKRPGMVFSLKRTRQRSPPGRISHWKDSIAEHTPTAWMFRAS